ncbi:MAG: ABC transporter ATP-binding protein [Candidatus Caldatribacteriota bacterium]
MKEVISLKSVWVSFNRVNVLEGINLSVGEKEFLGIIGPNGGGKTTLLKVILGLVNPDRGEVMVYGKSPKEGRKYIGYVPQYPLFDRDFPITVEEVVLMGIWKQNKYFHSYDKEDRLKVMEVLERVEMVEFKDEQIGRLSGGQQQRIFIARALISDPSILLLDEPLSSIDTRLQTGLYELLTKLKKKSTIVLVTHDLTALSIYVDKIACLNKNLFYHGSKEIKPKDLEAIYRCPIDLIAHGIPHRVLKKH